MKMIDRNKRKEGGEVEKRQRETKNNANMDKKKRCR